MLYAFETVGAERAFMLGLDRREFGIDMPRINVEDARAIPVPLPPMEEQRAIAATALNRFAVVPSPTSYSSQHSY